MAGTYLNLPFDAEVFNYDWKNTPDLVLTTMLQSGAVVRDSEIERLISNGSNFFTTPYYDVLGGDEDVYNGVNEFTDGTLGGGSYSGVVYGRMRKWSATSFIKDFNSGADPMAQIVSGVAQYYIKKRQERLVKLIDAVLGVSGMESHVKDVTTTGASVTDANRIGETTIADVATQALGDNSGAFSLVIAHSVVANRLANLQLLNFSKYTDAQGITRDLPIGTINGKTLIVNDNVLVEDSATASGEKEYATYILGAGAIRFAQAPVDVPSEMHRDPNLNGGTDMIYTRIREALVPYGFSFKGDVSTDVGIPDSVLLATASYELKMPHKSVALAKVVTNG
jgi:hypothetical protein